MNHLVLAYPCDERLMAQAADHFGPPVFSEGGGHVSFSFFGAPRSVLARPVDGVCVCGNVLNPEELGRIFSEGGFEEMDGVCVAARVRGGRADVITDRLGFHPLYQFSDGTRSIISTSLDFLGLYAGALSVDARAWGDMLAYGFCLNDRTPFREIRRVPHGMHIRVDGSGLSARRYEDYLSETPDLEDMGEAVERCHEALEWTVERYRRYSSRIAVPLSGGTDSRLCAALVSRHQRISCFGTSKDVGVFGDHSEIAMAERVAQSLGVEFHALQMPDNYFRRHFERTLQRTDFQTTCHTWYGELMERIPPEFVTIVDGLGDTSFKYDYISPRMLNLARRGRWYALGASIERLYRLLLVDRLSLGEEMTFFRPEQRDEMLRSRQQSFREQYNAMPQNVHLPVNMLMHTRFRRLIGPSVQQLLGSRFNVFSPYLGRRVNTLLWRCGPSVKRGLRLMDAYYSRHFPDIHPRRLPSTTASGIERMTEMALFDGIGSFPCVTGGLVYRLKPNAVRQSVQYSEDTLTFLHECIGQGSPRDNGGDFQAVLRRTETLSTVRQVDITIRLAAFSLWHRRYFRGGAASASKPTATRPETAAFPVREPCLRP